MVARLSSARLLKSSGSWKAPTLRRARPQRVLELVGNTALLVVLVTEADAGAACRWRGSSREPTCLVVALWAVAAALLLVIPSYVAALVLLAAFGPRGFLQQVLEGPFGIERVPEIYGLPGAVLAPTISTYPYVYLLAAAALRDLDPALEEASRSLGRSRAETFRRVTLPVLRPSLGAGALRCALHTVGLRRSRSCSTTRSRGRSTSSTARSSTGRRRARPGPRRADGDRATEQLRARARPVPPPLAEHGASAAAHPARWLALAALALRRRRRLALLLPLAVIGYWLERAVSLGRDLGDVWGPALNSILASTLAAGVAVAAALPVAILAVRYAAGWTRALERLSYSSNALPGIVIALARLLRRELRGLRLPDPRAARLRVRRPLSPQAVASSHSALLRVDPRLEEAARWARARGALRHGDGPARHAGAARRRRACLPLDDEELPATLLLAPIGFDTLATEVWTATTVAAYSEAALPALLLVVFSAPFVLLTAPTPRLGTRRVEIAAPGRPVSRYTGSRVRRPSRSSKWTWYVWYAARRLPVEGVERPAAGVELVQHRLRRLAEPGDVGSGLLVPRQLGVLAQGDGRFQLRVEDRRVGEAVLLDSVPAGDRQGEVARDRMKRVGGRLCEARRPEACRSRERLGAQRLREAPVRHPGRRR